MTERNASDAWLIFDRWGSDEPLGEIDAATRSNAVEAAAARWPGVEAYPVCKRDYEAQQRRLERDVARRAEAIAHHEAGHAVVGRLWFPVFETSIRPRILSRGRRFDPFTDSMGCTTLRHAQEWGWRYDAYVLAGPCAEFRYRGRRGWTRVSGSDGEYARALGDDFRRLEARARRLVDYLWPQIGIVAAALMEHGTLSGGAVSRLLEDRCVGRRQSTADSAVPASTVMHSP